MRSADNTLHIVRMAYPSSGWGCPHLSPNIDYSIVWQFNGWCCCSW